MSILGFSFSITSLIGLIIILSITLHKLDVNAIGLYLMLLIDLFNWNYYSITRRSSYNKPLLLVQVFPSHSPLLTCLACPPWCIYGAFTC